MRYIPRLNKDGRMIGQFDKQGFPKDFYWGTSTSSYQIEGGNQTDWSIWETSNRRIKELKDKNKNIAEFVCGDGVDFYHKYHEALHLAKQMGHNSFRFSIEWARIEPKAGEYSQEGIGFYKKLIRTCRELGIEPFVTIWHWTNPAWTVDMGGWGNLEVEKKFLKYVDFLLENLGKDVKYWMTLNEPVVWLSASYMKGIWPPQKRNPIVWYQLYKRLINVHKELYAKLKIVNPKSVVGIAQHVIWTKVYKNNLYYLIKQKIIDYVFNDWFIKATSDSLDFIGINHYIWYPMGLDKKIADSIPKSDMGWDLVPESLAEICKYMSKYKKPMYITEHGIADAENKNREWYIKESLSYLKQAINNGLDVKGYLHWSLLDNFEWAEGFEKKFGLVEVVR